MLWRALAGLAALTMASGCGGPQTGALDAGAPDVGRAPSDLVYRGIETRLLETDLVNFRVYMQGARGNADVAAYAECAAAQYALIRGFGFARHVRTNVQETGGVWQGDAVYTISADLPQGLSTIDAEVTVANCTETGIPTV